MHCCEHEDVLPSGEHVSSSDFKNVVQGRLLAAVNIAKHALKGGKDVAQSATSTHDKSMQHPLHAAGLKSEHHPHPHYQHTTSPPPDRHTHQLARRRTMPPAVRIAWATLGAEAARIAYSYVCCAAR